MAAIHKRRNTYDTLDMQSIFVIAIVSLITISFPERGYSQQAIYSDKNHYFAVLPPKGWVADEAPNETIRSKVAFRHPSLDLLIRVTAEPAVKADFSFDELYTQHEVRQGEMRKRFPGGKYEMKEGTMGDLRAVFHRNTYSNGDEHEMLSSVDNGIIYTIGLNAASLQELNKGHQAFEAFLTSFTPLSKGKIFSQAEIKASLVSKSHRLAELLEQQDKFADAIEFVTQGLAIDSNNAELRAMLKRLQSKK